MIAVVCVVAVFTMFSTDLHLLRDNVAATALFASNIYFWQTSGYFAAPAASQPLLHTWSLAVEEQFYVLFPLLLLVLHRRFPTWRNRVLWVGTLGSLALCTLLLRISPNAAFYLLPARAWELGAGALLAVSGAPVLSRPRSRDAISIVGLLLIIWSVVGGAPKLQHAWPMALLAVLGTSLAIYAGPASLAGKLLSQRPLVVLGLLSYSLYLWHWPLLVLYRDYALTSPSTVAGIWLTVASLALAALSWRFVEQPLRRVRIASTRRLLTVVGTVTASAGLLAVLVQPAGAVVKPTTPEVQRLLAYAHYSHGYQFRSNQCFLGSGATRGLDRDTCLRMVSGKQNWLLVGDSQAADLWRGVQESLPQVNVLQATSSGCRPLLGTTGAPTCTAMRDEVLGPFLATHRIQAVILSARWAATDQDQLLATVRALRQRATRVIIIGPHVEYRDSLPKLLARGLVNGDEGLARRRLDHERFVLDRQLRAAVAAAGSEYVSLIDVLCQDGRCREYAAPGVPTASDYGHLTLQAAREVGAALASRLH
jgi:peptidoglycan/LPS O-acetylase OafA/YrhL